VAQKLVGIYFAIYCNINFCYILLIIFHNLNVFLIPSWKKIKQNIVKPKGKKKENLKLLLLFTSNPIWIFIDFFMIKRKSVLNYIEM